MRSPAEPRLWAERALRAMSLAILAVMLWLSLDKSSRSASASVQGAASMPDLRAWSTSPIAPTEARITLDSLPSPVVRDWLAALVHSGTRVGWSGDLHPIAIATSAIASPAGGTSVVIAAGRGTTVELRDDVAPFDTVTAVNGGARFTVRADGPFTASESKGTARAARSDSTLLRRVLVLGSAGWESKFATAALEEAGWKVDEMIRVAPGIDVAQNAGYRVDTARYSAVIALDETAAPWATAIEEYVRSGGGVIIGPAAADRMPATLRAGIAGATVTPSVRDVPVTLANIPLSPVQQLRSDAVVLDRRANAVTIAARRHVAGRVIQIGYPESWRWRMAGDERGIVEHRDWWSRLVSAVAYAPRVPLEVSEEASNPAPFAALVSAIGPSLSAASIAQAPAAKSHSMVWLAILLSVTLLAEIASRRLRGAK
jgi:hypothetical protein